MLSASCLHNFYLSQGENTVVSDAEKNTLRTSRRVFRSCVCNVCFSFLHWLRLACFSRGRSLASFVCAELEIDDRLIASWRICLAAVKNDDKRIKGQRLRLNRQMRTNRPDRDEIVYYTSSHINSSIQLDSMMP